MQMTFRRQIIKQNESNTITQSPSGNTALKACSFITMLKTNTNIYFNTAYRCHINKMRQIVRFARKAKITTFRRLLLVFSVPDKS